MASLGPCSFCSKCGCLENELKFCPKCGVKVRIFPTGRCETTTTPFSLPNFHTFKSQKESERKTFFARKTHAGHKKRKVDDMLMKRTICCVMVPPKIPVMMKISLSLH